jgi:hypothetical protein
MVYEQHRRRAPLIEPGLLKDRTDINGNAVAPAIPAPAPSCSPKCGLR